LWLFAPLDAHRASPFAAQVVFDAAGSLLQGCKESRPLVTLKTTSGFPDEGLFGWVAVHGQIRIVVDIAAATTSKGVLDMHGGAALAVLCVCPESSWSLWQQYRFKSLMYRQRRDCCLQYEDPLKDPRGVCRPCILREHSKGLDLQCSLQMSPTKGVFSC
jgi:hypothetical protein